MPKGLFLSVGLNRVDPAAYGGWSGPLTACEADARDVADIATAMGHNGDLLLTAAATRSVVLQKISAAALTLSAGDLFVLFYSGHGLQCPQQPTRMRTVQSKD